MFRILVVGYVGFFALPGVVSDISFDLFQFTFALPSMQKSSEL